MSEQTPSGLEQLTPKQIVSELDRHIIGQDDAKRAVAIALHRWRRMQLSEELRGRRPKNILRSGRPVWVRQKSRAAAKLARAPFKK